MKILWLSHLIPYPPKAGVLLRSYNLIHELSKHHSVDLLSFIQRNFMETFFPSYLDGLEESQAVLLSFCDKVQFVPIPCESRFKGQHFLALKSLFTRDPYSINWLKSKLFLRSLQGFMKSGAYDLVHFDTISLCPYLDGVKGVATVLDHHNIESHMMRRRAEKEKNLFLKLYYRQEGIRLETYEKKYCNRFDLNITCSELDSRRLLQVDPEINVLEIPNGVDVEYFKSQNKGQDPNSLIFVGSMNWYPNVEAMHYFIADIWPLLILKVPDSTLHIVGANPPDSLKKLAEKDNRIIVHGFVEDVRPYMDKAAVYICPIRDGGGTKLKLLDAFAMEKAVVAHPVACEGINAEPGKDVFFAESPEGFVEKICALFSNTELRASLGTNARKMVQSSYSYNGIGSNLSAAYQQLAVSQQKQKAL